MMGAKAGMMDVVLPFGRHGFMHAYIELKSEVGRTTVEQARKIEALVKLGNFATVCHGWVEARETIEWYCNGKPTE